MTARTAASPSTICVHFAMSLPFSGPECPEVASAGALASPWPSGLDPALDRPIRPPRGHEVDLRRHLLRDGAHIPRWRLVVGARAVDVDADLLAGCPALGHGLGLPLHLL